MIALLLALLIIVPIIATIVARNVVVRMDRGPSSGSIDQSIIEARLRRIEEAIDAMALQIERLSDHQRALLGSSRDAHAADEPSRLRTES